MNPLPIRWRAAAWSLPLLAVFGIGWLDYVTGPDLGFSLFYLVPIAASGWLLGPWAAGTVAAQASGIWLLADLLLHSDAYAPVSAWNGLTRLVIFTTFGLAAARVRADQRSLDELNARLRELVDRERALGRVDPLTGLANARALREALQTELARARRSGAPLALAAVDLDNFKSVNDRDGHAAGDELLRAIGGAIRGALREGDVAARVGGDEFAILLADPGRLDPEAIGARLVSQVAATASAWPGVGASAGVVVFNSLPSHPDDVLRRADEALYAAKAAGKGRAVVLREGDSPPGATIDG